MVNIYTLEGCRFCSEAKSKMEEEGILYTEFCETSHPDTCKKLEDSLKTDLYPMIKIAGGTKPVFIISNSTGYPRSLYPHIYYFDSIPHLIHLIKSHI